jgi:hypothetical protein
MIDDKEQCIGEKRAMIRAMLECFLADPTWEHVAAIQGMMRDYLKHHGQDMKTFVKKLTEAYNQIGVTPPWSKEEHPLDKL